MHASSRGTEEAAGSPRRADVIATAGELFRLHGYERTTVRELARAVGLQSGSLFHHFRSKEEILVAVMSEGIEEVLEQGALALAHYQDPGRAWRRCSGCTCGACSRGRGDAMNALVYEWRSLSPAARGGVKALSDRYEDMWQDAVDDALRAGLVDGDARVIKRYLLGGLNLTVQWYRPQGRLAPGDFIEAMLRAALPGLPPGTGAWPLRD